VGVRHARTVTAYADGHWQVRDEMLPLRMPWDKRPIRFRLHWLLPDWAWEADLHETAFEILLQSPHGRVTLTINDGLRMPKAGYQISLFRAGRQVYVSGPAGSNSQAESTIRGWVSPTYAVKVPALSLAVETESANDVQFISEFNFPS
jgi:hypothetical protein